MVRIAALIIVVLLGTMTDRVAWGAETPDEFICHFDDGGAWTFEKQKYLRKDSKPLDMHIFNGKKGSQTATLKTRNGLAKLKRVAALDADHYLEVTVGGYLNITTIFDQDSAKDGYPAVSDRPKRPTKLSAADAPKTE